MSQRGIDWSAAEAEKREIDAVESFLTAKGITIRNLLGAILSLSIPLYVLYRAAFGTTTARVDRSIIVTLLVCFVFLFFPLEKKAWNERRGWLFAIDLVCIILAIASQIYIFWGQTLLYADTSIITIQLGSYVVRADYVVGLITILLVLEATRRTTGWILVSLPIFFALYALFAGYFPGVFRSVAIDFGYMLEILFVLEEGMYGLGCGCLLDMVFLFLLFGILLNHTRTSAFFLSLSNSLFGGQRGGPAKVAVTASAMMGTMSGSAISNVATTGAISIPMMKKLGYSPRFAAAVESVASNGGQIMPPIMGVAAFIMASLLGIPYRNLIIYASIPAICYFISVYLIVHGRSVQSGLEGQPRETLPSLKRVLMEGGHLVIPIFILLYLLFVGYSITFVGLSACLSVLVFSFFRKETRLTPTGILVALGQGMRSIAPVSVSMVLCGILIGLITVSGLGVKLTDIVVVLSGGHLIVGLILAAIVAIILGMGMATMFVYLNMVFFVVPALVKMGVIPLSAHLFAMYFGIVSGVTPPVCLVAFTAASIAGSDPMRTGVVAAKVGIATYVLPLAFVLHPGVLIYGATPLAVISDTLLTISVTALFALGVEGALFRKMYLLERLVALAAAIALLFLEGSIFLSSVGICLVAALLISQKILPRQKAGIIYE